MHRGITLALACAWTASAAAEVPRVAPARAPAPAVPVGLGSPTTTTDDPPGTGRAASIELTFVGDVMFGGFFFTGAFAPKKPEPGDPFAAVEALLASDLALANLETPVLRDVPQTRPGTKKMHFVASVEQVATLPRHGVTAVSVANNHQYDMGTAGAHETMAILGELGITAIGGPRATGPRFRVETIEVRGWKLGFVAATRWANHVPAATEPQPALVPSHGSLVDELVPVIEAATADHDAVIVVIHWGREWKDAPSSSQVRAAHAFVDAGATAVIGTHPHVLQGIERYRGGVIAYSLGNFVFRNVAKIPRQTGVLRLALRDGVTSADRCLARVDFHPAIERKKPFYHPVPADRRGFRQVARRLITLSADLRTRWRVKGDRLTTPGACR